MNCTKCGAALEDGAQFCAACGQRIAPASPRFCTRCGRALDETTNFCPGCGREIHPKKVPVDDPPKAESGRAQTRDLSDRKPAPTQDLTDKKPPVPPEPRAKSPEPKPKAPPADRKRPTIAEKAARKDAADTETKQKFKTMFHNMDVLDWIFIVLAGIALVLLVIGILKHAALAILAAVLLLAAAVCGFLIRKGIIDSEQRWSQYVMLLLAVLLIAANIFSYSIGKDSGGEDSAPSVSTVESGVEESEPAEPAGPFIPLSPGGCIGQNYQDIVSAFEDAGFTNVTVEPVEDLAAAESAQIDTVASITVGGSESFAAGQEADRYSVIAITYHVYRKCFVRIHVDFTENIIFSKYDVTFRFNNIEQGTMTHGDGCDYSFTVDPGTYTLDFTDADNPDISGSAEIEVTGDVDVSLTITCHMREIDVVTDSVTAPEDTINDVIGTGAPVEAGVDNPAEAAPEDSGEEE